MSNLYDNAYLLEKEIRNHPDFVSISNLKKEIEQDESTKQLLQSSREIQIKFQTMQMMGQEPQEEEIEASQQVVTVAQQNEKIRNYLEAEQRLSMVINEITMIILKPLEDLM